MMSNTVTISVTAHYGEPYLSAQGIPERASVDTLTLVYLDHSLSFDSDVSAIIQLDKLVNDFETKTKSKVSYVMPSDPVEGLTFDIFEPSFKDELEATSNARSLKFDVHNWLEDLDV